MCCVKRKPAETTRQPVSPSSLHYPDNSAAPRLYIQAGWRKKIIQLFFFYHRVQSQWRFSSFALSLLKCLSSTSLSTWGMDEWRSWGESLAIMAMFGLYLRAISLEKSPVRLLGHTRQGSKPVTHHSLHRRGFGVQCVIGIVMGHYGHGQVASYWGSLRYPFAI